MTEAVNMFFAKAIFSVFMQNRLRIMLLLAGCLKKQDFSTKVH